MTTDTPYYPLGVTIVDYVPNTMSTGEILLFFSGTLALVLVPAFMLARRLQLSRYETWSMLWFILSGLIHLVLEGTSPPFFFYFTLISESIY